MASLSVAPDDGGGPFYVVANPIYVTSPITEVPYGGPWTFELLENGAAFMLRHIGDRRLFSLGGEHLFWGEIIGVERAAPHHSTLQAMPERPVMRVTMVVHHDQPERLQ